MGMEEVWALGVFTPVDLTPSIELTDAYFNGQYLVKFIDINAA